MGRIWLPLIVKAVLYLIAWLWIIIAFHKAGKKLPAIAKFSMWATGAAILYWFWKAVVASIGSR